MTSSLSLHVQYVSSSTHMHIHTHVYTNTHAHTRSKTSTPVHRNVYKCMHPYTHTMQKPHHNTMHSINTLTPFAETLQQKPYSINTVALKYVYSCCYGDERILLQIHHSRRI